MPPPGAPARRDGRFATTHWSLILAAGSTPGPAADQALAGLYELYWYPVYAFIRRRGHSPDDAADLTQEFFSRLIERSILQRVKPEGGHFRSFLLTCLRNFLANERDRSHAVKRGAGMVPLSLDADAAEQRYVAEPRDEVTPERIFDRRWAIALIDRSLDRLGEEYAANGKSRLFDVLKRYLTGDAEGVSHAAVASGLGMSEGASKVALHRLRRRFRDILISEVAATVDESSDVEDEVRYLLKAIG